MKLHPFYECGLSALKHIEDGADMYQKFQCEKCMVEQHMDTPNAFYMFGKCEECNHVTNIEKNGCNYLLVIAGDKAIDYLEKKAEKESPKDSSKVDKFV